MSTYTEVIRRDELNPYVNLMTGTVCSILFLTFVYLLLSSSLDRSGMTNLYILMMVQLTPIILTLVRGKFNYLTFVLANHFIVYSTAKYNLITNIQKLKAVPPETLTAFSEMTYCTVLIIFSYLFFRWVVLPKQPDARRFNFLHVNDRVYVWMGLFIAFQPFINLFVPTTFLTINMTIFAICIVIVLCSECGNPAMQRWVKVGIAFSALQSFIMWGSLSVLGMIGSVFFIVSVIQRKFQNFVILALMVCLGLVFQSIKMEFRVLSRENDDHLPVIERIKILGGLLAWKYLGDINGNPLIDPQETYVPEDDEAIIDPAKEELDVKETFAKGFTRVGDDSLERVLAMTPGQVPFWEGESYTNIIYFFIPRFLWPGKPSRDLWNKFGRRYGFLSQDDMSTSVGVNFLGEGYMNFGYMGLYTIAMIFGFLVASMEALSNVFLDKPNYFTFISFAAPFLNYGLDFGSILNSIVLMIVLLTLLRYRLINMISRDVYAT